MRTKEAAPLEVLSMNPDQTRRIGKALGEALRAGDVICLEGDLGAGKTTLVQGLAQGWGSVDSVSSPTFILVNLYRRAGGMRLFHLDAYRLESVPEAEELDLDSMLAEGALIVEWPERLGRLIPGERMWIHLEHAGIESRRLKFEARGARYAEWLDSIRSPSSGGN
jgi:tRNA threonylcarbamoyladenosine biosynthesis protein TsaE